MAISTLKKSVTPPPPPPPAPKPAAKPAAGAPQQPAASTLKSATTPKPQASANTPKPASTSTSSAGESLQRPDTFSTPAEKPKPQVALSSPQTQATRSLSTGSQPVKSSITDARGGTGSPPPTSITNTLATTGSPAKSVADARGKVAGPATQEIGSASGGVKKLASGAQEASTSAASGYDKAAAALGGIAGSASPAAAERQNFVTETDGPLPTPAGTQRAQDAATVPTVADDRAQAEASEQAARDQAAAEAAEIQALAEPGAQPPPNTQVDQRGDTTYVTTRNDAGEVVSVRTASTDGDNVSVSNTQYNEDGTATRQSVEVSEDSVVVQEGTWNEARSANPQQPRTQEELVADPTATTREQTFTEIDGNPAVRTVESNSDGVLESTSTFREQDDFDDINGGLHDQFQTKVVNLNDTGYGPSYPVEKPDPPLDRVDTNTTVTPRGGEPQEIQQTSFSQDGVRVTSTDTVNEEGEANPRSWTLDVQVSATERRSQDFVEGNQDFQRVTTTHADGNHVSVSTETQWKDEEGVEQRATEDYDTTYADDGTVAHAHSETVDEHGSQTITDYQRETAENGETTETTTVSQDPADGPPLSTSEAITTRPGANGRAEFVRGSVTTTGPDGTATASLDASRNVDPYAVTVDGQPVTDQSQLSEEQAALAAAALDGLTAGIYDRFAPPEPGGRPGDDASDASKYTEQLKNIAGIPAAVHEAANNQLAATRAKVGVSSAGAASSALGLLSAGQNLAQSIRAGDVGQAIADGASAVGSLVGAGEAAAVYGTRNIPAGQTAGTSVGRLAQGVARWAGPVGSLINVGTSIFDLTRADGDPFKISQAAVGIAGGTLAAAVGIAAATGAVGGPVGAAVGAAIGLITYGVQWLIGKASETDIPEVVIRD